MKKTLKGYIIGFLTAAILVTGVSAAGSFATLYDVMVGGINIVVDGQKLNPTDANGNAVDAGIYNGTTYLPVRAVANALGKAVYWDGPNYTVYLGDMDGKLEYPTVELENMTSINQTVRETDRLTDNYGNVYSRAIRNADDSSKFEYLLNMKYSRFRGTLYVPAGETGDESVRLKIIADDKTIYTSPDITKTSYPVKIDVDVTGCNNLKIEFTGETNWYYGGFDVCLGDAGFYQ